MNDPALLCDLAKSRSGGSPIRFTSGANLSLLLVAANGICWRQTSCSAGHKGFGRAQAGCRYAVQSGHFSNRAAAQSFAEPRHGACRAEGDPGRLQHGYPGPTRGDLPSEFAVLGMPWRHALQGDRARSDQPAQSYQREAGDLSGAGLKARLWPEPINPCPVGRQGRGEALGRGSQWLALPKIPYGNG
jgi:hypothetical protein